MVMSMKNLMQQSDDEDEEYSSIFSTKASVPNATKSQQKPVKYVAEPKDDSGINSSVLIARDDLLNFSSTYESDGNDGKINVSDNVKGNTTTNIKENNNRKICNEEEGNEDEPDHSNKSKDETTRNINDYNEANTDTVPIPTSEESKRTKWFKDQMSGPLKRFSLNKSSISTSLDTSLNNSFDSDYPLSESPPTKTSSVMDLKSHTELNKEESPKRRWLNKPFSSYLSNKSKISNRSSPAPMTSSEMDLRTTQKHNKDDNREDDYQCKEMKSLDNISERVFFNSSNESHLPLLQQKQSQQQDSSPVSKMVENANDARNKTDALSSTTGIASNRNESPKNDTFKSGGKEKTVKTNLSLSDLLQRSPSSTVDQHTGKKSLFSPSKFIDKNKETVLKTLKNNSDEDDVMPTDHELEVLTDTIVKEDLEHHFKPTQNFPITFFHLWISSLLMFWYLVFWLPPYISGVITGGLIVYLLGCSTLWFFGPSGSTYNQYREDLKRFLRDEHTKKGLEDDIFKNIPIPDSILKPRMLKAWMMFSWEYNNTFEKDTLKNVYVVLVHETLHLFLGKEILQENKVSKKMLKRETRKAADERMEKEKALFTFEWHFEVNLKKCSVSLEPADLPIRRIWSRKFPMKLVIPREEVNKRRIDITLEHLTMFLDDIVEGSYIFSSLAYHLDTDEEIYLFANTGHEKEHFFYRIQVCVKPLKHQVSFEDIKMRRLSKNPKESYAHYMVELMTESEKVVQRHTKGKKMEPYLAWLNIFLGRAFWDFWHDKYWTDKLHQKIQNRLSKINTPPFITSITLKDLNCGHNIPLIHKGSVPTIDAKGVWTDLQITYKGYFTLTLETQLNVDYYVDLVSSIVKKQGGVDPKNHTQLSKLTTLSKLSAEDNSYTDEDLNISRVSKTDTTTSDMLDSGASNVSATLLNAPSFGDSYDEQILHEELHEVYLDDGMEQTDGLDNPLLSDPRTKAFLESSAGKKMVNLVGWLAKSKIAKRVAETEFAKKAYERAYEKFRKMPIILKVEVQSVKGILATNIPPPPTNRLWFGFRNSPVIFITASPKVGEKNVRLTYLTNWIERKLKEEFKKYLVMPNMQDITLKLMDSQLKDIHPEQPMS